MWKDDFRDNIKKSLEEFIVELEGISEQLFIKFKVKKLNDLET